MCFQALPPGWYPVLWTALLTYQVYGPCLRGLLGSVGRFAKSKDHPSGGSNPEPPAGSLVKTRSVGSEPSGCAQVLNPLISKGKSRGACFMFAMKMQCRHSLEKWCQHRGASV